MHSLKRILLGAALLAGLSGMAQAQQPSAEQALVARGEYLARAGDCMACHTAPGGQPFAGGLPIESDLGTIFSTNITPDREAGIGAYTEEQFAAALRQGKRADGANLYPAMPYPSYRLVTDEDVHALYTYFMKGVQPAETRPQETALNFPFNQRWGLWFWNLFFTPTGTFEPDPKASAEINRGAYLVEGLGHCGACHTPRAAAMQESATDGSSEVYLAGADVGNWHAPQLRAGGEASRGVPNWSQQDIVDYLGTGRNAHAAVGGEMRAVVEHSTAHMTDADLRAMAAYLQSLPNTLPRPAPASAPAATAAATTAKLTAAVNLTEGERLYLDNCGACHFVTGKGAERVFPALDGASIINAQNPGGLISTILAGASTPSTERAPSILPMPGFAYRLSDAEVASLSTFIRSGWTNDAPAVTAEQVAKIRASLQATPTH
jgi:mono/diheme cytochrome c family protein